MNRACLLEIILTAINAWIAADCPQVRGKELPSYESWSHIMESLFSFLGFDNFLEQEDFVDQVSDPICEIWDELVSRWLQKFDNKPVTVEQILLLLNSDGLLKPLLGNNEKIFPQKIALGKLLVKKVGHIHYGHKIAVPRKNGKTANQYALVRMPKAGDQGEFEEVVKTPNGSANWTWKEGEQSE